MLTTLAAAVCILFAASSIHAGEGKAKPFSGKVASFQDGVLVVEHKKSGESKEFTITEEVEIAKSDKSEATMVDLKEKTNVRIMTNADGSVKKVIVSVPKPKGNKPGKKEVNPAEETE